MTRSFSHLILLTICVGRIASECVCTCDGEAKKAAEVKIETSIDEGSGQDISVNTNSPERPASVTTIPLQPIVDADTCQANAECYSDDECDGGKCVGFAVGTCQCNCLSFMMCATDKGCGGLKGSCNLRNYKCDCLNGLRRNGVSGFLQALAILCNVKKCNGETAQHACYGMPCHAGRCMC